MATASSLQFDNIQVLKLNLDALINLSKKGSIQNISSRQVTYCYGRLYDMNVGYDWIFQMILNVCCRNKESNMQRVKDCLNDTKKIFDNNLKMIVAALDGWSTYLKFVSDYDVRSVPHGQSQSMDSLRTRIREVVCEWNKIVTPFLELQMQDKGCDAFKLEVSQTVVRRWQNCTQLCTLEWAIDEEVPLRALTRVLTWNPLSGERVHREYDAVSKSAIRKFCGTLESREGFRKLTRQKLSKMVFQAMLGLVKEMNRNYEGQLEYQRIIIGQMSHVLTILKSEGCTLFDINDSAFLAWRANLTLGTQFKDGSITLIERLGKHSAEKPVVHFMFQESPDQVLAFYNNGVCAPIKANERVQLWRMYEKDDFTVANVKAVDEEFHFVAYDRVESFNIVERTSAQIQTFVALVRKMILGDRSFDCMAAKDWGFVQNSPKIACKKPVQVREREALLGWQSLIQAFAGSSRELFLELMQQTGILQHPVAEFYREAIVLGLSGHEDQLDVMIKGRRFGRNVDVNDVLKQAKTFYVNAKTTHNSAVALYASTCTEAIISQAIVNAHKKLRIIHFEQREVMALLETEIKELSAQSGVSGFLSKILGVI